MKKFNNKILSTIKIVTFILYVGLIIVIADMFFVRFVERIPALQSEVYLQTLRPALHRRTDLQGLFYELKPEAEDDKSNIRINSLGMRDKPLREDQVQARVIVLGDSVTFGNEVKSEELFTEVAEGLLNERGLNVEILNAGVCGYNTKQEFIALKHKYSKLNPDIVIFTYCSDDMTQPAIQYLPDDYVQDELIKNGKEPYGVPFNYRNLTKIQYLSIVLPKQISINYKTDRWLLKNSGFYRTISLLLFKVKNNLEDVNALPNFLFFYDFDKLLSEINLFSQQNNFKLIFMVLPTNRQWDKKDFLRKTEKQNVTVWDLDAKIKRENKNLKNIWVIDPHLNIKGHHLAGEALCKKLDELIR